MRSAQSSIPVFICMALIAASHLAVIPILALYGVKICPVLHGLGFRFGCLTNSGFIFSVLALNFIFQGGFFLLGLSWIQNFRKSRNVPLAFQSFPYFSTALYGSAFTLATWGLLRFLTQHEVPAPSIDRLRNALTITGILLGVFQARLVDLLWTRWVRMQFSFNSNETLSRNSSLFRPWVFSKVWQGLPLIGALTIEAMVVRQNFESDDFQRLYQECGKIALLLALWLLAIGLIQFFKESAAILDIQIHLQALAELKTDHRTSEIAAGSWGAVYRSLNQASETLNERARLVEGFSRYVTQSVVQDVLQDRELESSGESVDLFILMADLRDFTRLSNSLEPNQVVLLLNTYLNDMIPVLTRRGLVLDKFIGDGILAYLDPRALPSSQNAADRAVQAAFEMHEALIETNRKLARLDLPPLALGNALHFGSVVLGNIGSIEKLQHTIIGDAVNTAARLESLCKDFECGIVVAESVASLLSPEFRSRLVEEAPRAIRGLSQSVRVFSGLPKMDTKRRVA